MAAAQKLRKQYKRVAMTFPLSCLHLALNYLFTGDQKTTETFDSPAVGICLLPWVVTNQSYLDLSVHFNYKCCKY
jgi:hypothetical protein